MNWVGGARSRLKLPNEKKVQRDYFQRKRLTAEVKRTNAHNYRAPISKDLLFLSKTASITAAGPPNASPIRPAPRRINLNSATKQHPRDIELPMSPIEKPSTLDLMEISMVSFSSSGGFQPPILNTGHLPKVSTQKIPHGTALYSFGAKARDTAYRGIGRGTDVLPPEMSVKHQVREETAGRDMTDMACVTESLFLTGRNKQESVGTTLSETSRNELGITHNIQPCKEYSIDDILNSSQFKESFIPQRTTKKQTVTKIKPKHADALLWERPSQSISRKRVNPFRDHDEIKGAATRKMQKAERPYQFEKRNILQEKSKISYQPLKNEVELIQDEGDILEIHYTQQDKTTEDCHCKLDHNGDCKKITEASPYIKQKVMEQKIDLGFPWSRSPSLKASKESTDSSLLTENPFSKRDKYRVQQDFDLTIHDQTLLNESIIGPVKNKRLNEATHNKLKKPKEKMQGSYSALFEQMMSTNANTEKEKGNHLKSGCNDFSNGPFMMTKDAESKLTDVHCSEPADMRLDTSITAQHCQWKDFVSGQVPKNTDDKKDDIVGVVKAGIVLKDEGRNPSLPQVTELRDKRTLKSSTFRELIHLKQETLEGLDDFSQDPTLSPLEWSEEPIRREVPKSPESKYRKNQREHPFDSSLDASLNLTTYHDSCDIASSNSQYTAVSTQSLLEQEVPMLGGYLHHEEDKPLRFISSQSSMSSESFHPHPNTAVEHMEEVPDPPSLEYETVICTSETHQQHTKPDRNVQNVANIEELDEIHDTHNTAMNNSVLVPFSMCAANTGGAHSVSTQTTPSHVSESLSKDIASKTQTITNISLKPSPLNSCLEEVQTNDCHSIKQLYLQFGSEVEYNTDSQQATVTETTTQDTTDKNDGDIVTAYQNGAQSKPDHALNRIYDEVITPNHTRNQNNSRDAWMQTNLSAMNEVDVLRGEIERLQEELKMKESDIIWQSLMIKILNM